MYPYGMAKPSLFSIFKGIKFSSFLDGAQKTLGVVNQTIPLIYQVKPMISNAKTMFKIADVIKTDDNTNNISVRSTNDINKPIFYM